ncbi:MAG: transposase zinc-binding domain-containing protein, partial [Candidatus Brocadiaceae bacterium]|nr:transposase zinc-binding domain-containing protein [Candidatus Brocadiaceae bacterium]
LPLTLSSQGLAFSCKGRWFCPSCHAKKVVQFGELLKETILYPVPHRQYVFSLPILVFPFCCASILNKIDDDIIRKLLNWKHSGFSVHNKAWIARDDEKGRVALAQYIIDVSEYQPRRIPSKQWRDCIKKIYEADPLCCPKCGGEMKLVYELFDDLSAFNTQADGWSGYDESCMSPH